jgi:hypothetical protein
MLAPTPDRDNTGERWITAVWVLVDDHDAASHNLPARLAGIATPLPVSIEYRGLYIGTSEPQLPRLIEGMERPAHGDRRPETGSSGGMTPQATDDLRHLHPSTPRFRPRR